MIVRQSLFFSHLVLTALVVSVPSRDQTARSQQVASKRNFSQQTLPDEKLLLAGARQSDASSQMWLAAGYEQGWFGKANFAEASKWFRKAAEQGDPDAQTVLGKMYEDGEGVTQNYTIAAKWYKKAAEHVPDLNGHHRVELIWECSIWMAVVFRETTFKLTFGSGWATVNQTCLLPRLT